MTDEVEIEAAPEEAPEAAPLTPTSAADWPANGKVKPGVVVELPSGAVARIARPPLTYRFMSGIGIPPKIAAAIAKKGAALFEDPLNAMSADERRVLVDWMVALSFVEPRVSMTRKEGAVFIGDLTDLDKDEVVNLLHLSLAG